MKWLLYYSILVLLGFTATATGDEIVQGFKSPAFSGIGTSSHYLTIDEQEKTRRDEIAEDIESALKDAESLFDSEKGGTGGSIVLEGSTIKFVNDGASITLTVIDEDGTITEIIIPVGIFGICSDDCGI